LPDCILISVALQRKMKVALRPTGSGEGKTDRGQHPGAEQDRSMSSPKMSRLVIQAGFEFRVIHSPERCV